MCFTGLSYLGIALPAFWFGLILIQVLAVEPRRASAWIEPPLYFIGLHSPGETGFGLDYLRHLVLPVLTLTITLVASWSRFGRAAMLDALSSDYVRTARAKGVPRRQIIFRHAFATRSRRLSPSSRLDAALLFGGLVVTEQIFAIPGMGRLFLDSLRRGRRVRAGPVDGRGGRRRRAVQPGRRRLVRRPRPAGEAVMSAPELVASVAEAGRRGRRAQACCGASGATASRSLGPAWSWCC